MQSPVRPTPAHSSPEVKKTPPIDGGPVKLTKNLESAIVQRHPLRQTETLVFPPAGLTILLEQKQDPDARHVSNRTLLLTLGKK